MCLVERSGFGLNALLGCGPTAAPPNCCPTDYATCKSAPNDAVYHATSCEVDCDSTDNDPEQRNLSNRSTASKTPLLRGALTSNLLLSLTVRLKDGLGKGICLCLVHLRFSP